MTKEEILDKHLNTDDAICCDREIDYIDDYGVYQLIESAMVEYAKQVAVNFAKWISNHPLNFQTADNKMYIGLNMIKYSAEELFELYLKSKKI